MSGLFDVYQTNVKMLFQKISNNLDSISTETENIICGSGELHLGTYRAEGAFCIEPL